MHNLSFILVVTDYKIAQSKLFEIYNAVTLYNNECDEIDFQKLSECSKIITSNI